MNYIDEEIKRIDWYPENSETKFIEENSPLLKESRFNNFSTVNFFKYIGSGERVDHTTNEHVGKRYADFRSSYCIFGPGWSSKTNIMITYAKSQNIKINFGSNIKTIKDIDVSELIVIVDALN